LFGDLLDNGGITTGDQGQTGNLGIIGFGHAEAFNVKATTTEEACHAG
jgi:hypothetical protein